jgi:hypothetical protein
MSSILAPETQLPGPTASPPPARQKRKASPWLVAGAVILGLAGVNAVRRQVSGPPELEPARLPGLELRLPAWNVQTPGTKEWFQGIHRRDASTSTDGFVIVRWMIGEPLEVGDVEPLVNAMPGMTSRSSGSTQVCGAPASTMTLSNGRVDLGLLTWWHAEGRNMLLTTVMNPDRGSARELHDKILRTVVCTPKPADAVRAPFPDFAAPEGFERDEQPDVLAWSSETQAITVFPGVNGRSAYGDLERAPAGLRTKLLENTFAGVVTTVSLGTTPRYQAQDDGSRQIVFVGAAVDPDGAPVRLMLASFVCAAPERSFIAVYYGATSTSEASGLELLRRVRCPK